MNQLTLNTILQELEALAGPAAETLSDSARVTAFIHATNKLRPMLETAISPKKRKLLHRLTAMNDSSWFWYLIGFLIGAFTTFSVAHADTSRTSVTVVINCSNTNWEHSPRCTAPVDYFFTEENGETWGMLTSGVTFQQRNVTNELGVRLQRFTMEDVVWYVSDLGIIYADSSTQALSIYLARDVVR